jgi:hypothetical protein
MLLYQVVNTVSCSLPKYLDSQNTFVSCPKPTVVLPVWDWSPNNGAFLCLNGHHACLTPSRKASYVFDCFVGSVVSIV